MLRGDGRVQLRRFVPEAEIMATLGQLLGEKQFKGKMKYMQVRGRRRPLRPPTRR